MKGLTFEESGLLFQYRLRKGLGEAFDQKEPSPVGKTVGDLIDAERDRQDQEKKEKDDEERLAKEAKAKEEALAAGEKAKWTGTIEFNRFSDEKRRFRDAELSNLKVVWLPTQILFADGSKLGEE